MASTGFYVFIGFLVLAAIIVIVAGVIFVKGNQTVTGGCCTTNGCVTSDETSCFTSLGGYYMGDNTVCSNIDCTLGCCTFQGNGAYIPKSLCNKPNSTFQAGQQCIRTGFMPGDVIRLFNLNQNGWLVYCDEGPGWCETATTSLCLNIPIGSLCPGSHLAITTSDIAYIQSVQNIDEWTVIVNNSDPTIISLLNTANGQFLLTTTCNATLDATACNGSFDGNYIEVDGLSPINNLTQFTYSMSNPTATNPTVTFFDNNSEQTASRGIVSIPALQIDAALPCNISDAGIVFSSSPCTADVWQVTFVNPQ